MGKIQALKAYAMKGATISNTAKAISHADFSWAATNLANAERAVIGSRTNGVMYTTDGTDPTATLGHLIATNGSAEISGNANIIALKFIREAGADAALTVTLYK